MPLPRQGRKGGKITSVAPESTTAAEVPNPKSNNVPETAAAAPAAENREAAPLDGTQPKEDKKTTSAWLDSALQMDRDAVQQVGRGSLVRGLKTAQTEVLRPTSSLQEVQSKLKEVLNKQKPTRYNLKTVLRESMDATSKHHVAIINPNDGHLLAVQLAASTAAETPKVLVVVSHYYEVSETAKTLREMKEARKEVPEVGELVGASATGEKRFNLWVTSAESANLYLCTKSSFAPFTHIIFPELISMTPLVSFFLFAIRNHLQTTEHRVKIIVGTTVRYSVKLSEYFSAIEGIDVKSLVNPSTTIEFSYDEACALAEVDVLKLIGATSQRLPDKKATAHCASVAATIVKNILKDASVPQRIQIFAGDTSGTRDFLSALSLKDTVIWTKQSQIEKVPPTSSKPEKHWIYILSNAECPSVTGYLPPHFVIDLGTMGQQIQPQRDEGFVGGRVTVWTTTEELEEHRSLVCPSGGYFRLFPDLSDSRQATSVSYSVYEVETALLQSARTNIPNNEALIYPIPQDIMETTVNNLSDNCLTVPTSDLTFTGEMAARMPLGTDLVTFIIHCCAMGLGEPAVVVASVCVLSLRRRIGNTEAESQAWAETIRESREAMAPSLAAESDLLADAAVYLEWHRRLLKKDPTATTTFPNEIGVALQRLHSVRKLIDHLCTQLSDYVFLDNFDDEEAVQQVVERLKTSAALIAVTYAVSSSRRALVVRDAGTASLKDRNATLAFVRTAKKVFPSAMPSSVPWESLAILIAADVRTDKLDRGFEGARFTSLDPSFYNAALLLLYPSVVYSAPQAETGAEHMVFFGISCNSHRKRYRVPLSQANLILSFRDKWNLALGYLHALRMLPRPISRQRFFNALRERDRCFNLENFYHELQHELMQLVMELDVYEHHGSFDLLHSHYLCPNVIVSQSETEASDCVLARDFEKATSWPVTLSRGTTPAGDTRAGSRDFPISEDEKDDEVEDISEIYFLNHDPIVD